MRAAPEKAIGMERFRGWLLGRGGLWAAVIWGFAEGTVFFLVPDILITLGALFSVKKSFGQTAGVLAGSLAAGALLFVVAAGGQTWVTDTVKRVPFVREEMFTKTTASFQEHGVGAMLRGPTSGIPYKVYAVIAPRYTTLGVFLAVSIPARLERFIVTWAGFGIAGWVLRRQIAARPGWALAGHGLFWVGIYVYYWSVI